MKYAGAESNVAVRHALPLYASVRRRFEDAR
jgi:hypothetical protein